VINLTQIEKEQVHDFSQKKNRIKKILEMMPRIKESLFDNSNKIKMHSHPGVAEIHERIITDGEEKVIEELKEI